MKRITKNFNSIIRGADGLSLAISIVAAILIGFFIGHFLTKLTGWIFFTYFFTIIGICSAILNIYRAIKLQKKDMLELENDPKYKKYEDIVKNKKDIDDDDYDEKWD